MKIELFIDNNVWDIFFDNEIDLSKELPNSDFNLLITREAEFEIQPMPKEKKLFVQKAITQVNIVTDRILGFSDKNFPQDEQRIGGFGDKFNLSINGGRFIREVELQTIKEENHLIGTKNLKTHLYKHEADIAIAARANHSFVLTCDNKRALKRARKKTDKVIDLKKWDNTNTLSEFIKAEIRYLTNLQLNIND